MGLGWGGVGDLIRLRESLVKGAGRERQVGTEAERETGRRRQKENDQQTDRETMMG